MRHTICVDFDGTLELAKGEPNEPLIQFINQQSARIFIWSSRDWIYYDYIEDWLNRHQVKYDNIILGKPLADLYIDDRSVSWERHFLDMAVEGSAHLTKVEMNAVS